MPRSRIQPLTVVEHRELGLRLYEMHETLTRRGSEVSNRYGVTKKVGRLLLKTVAELSRARCELDEQLLRDHPASFCPDVYYPGPEDRRAEHLRRCDICRTESHTS